MRHIPSFIRISLSGLLFCAALITGPSLTAADKTKLVDLGGGATLELVGIPAGEFRMGSTPAVKARATCIEGGAQSGTARESYEGEQSRLMRVKDAFWMGRTEVSVEQFRRFVEATGFVTDAEKPGGETQVFYSEWDGFELIHRQVGDTNSQ